ncbi:MAG: mannonate dehydratase, partial [Candidatus Latescibacteria bacterium]|nr:mannonate dehydratase [Candidatus Latescibacterota bacterium]
MTIQEHLPYDQVNDESLGLLRAIGVDYLSIHPSPPTWDGEDRLDYWLEMRGKAESHGLQLRNVGTKTWEEICLDHPDRDEKVAAWCTMLRNLGAAGIPTLGYTFQPG